LRPGVDPGFLVRGDDGKAEGPERGTIARSAGAPREWGLGRGAVTPPRYVGLGA